MTTNTSTVKTWHERIGATADFPLHAPTDVERAMEAEIAELRAQQSADVHQASAAADMLDMLGRIEPLAMHDRKDREQWYERLCRARAVQQPLPVPDQAAVVWRSDLVRAVAELIQLRAYRDHLRAERARKDADQQGVAARDVSAERHRQVEQEGYDPEHDDAHPNGEIAAYAAFYAMPPAARAWPAIETGYGETFGEAIIPADWTQPKTGDRRRELVKAGALILAEIERIDRANGGAA